MGATGESRGLNRDMSKISDPQRFDASYYARFYEDYKTRVTSIEATVVLVRFVVAYLRYIGIEPRKVLDVGCGLGLWRTALEEIIPEFSTRSYKYFGVEVSDAACDRFGWQKLDISAAAPRGRFDLVICAGVLQYVSDRYVGRALANLAQCCRGAVYLQIATKEDWATTMNQTASDQEIYLRPVRWYLGRIMRHFMHCGGGIFVPRSTTLPFWELEICHAHPRLTRSGGHQS